MKTAWIVSLGNVGILGDLGMQVTKPGMILGKDHSGGIGVRTQAQPRTAPPPDPSLRGLTRGPTGGVSGRWSKVLRGITTVDEVVRVTKVDVAALSR